MFAALTLAVVASSMPSRLFAGVTLGETQAEVVATRGEPATAGAAGDSRSHFIYLAPAGGALQILGFDRRRVTHIELALGPLNPNPQAAQISAQGVYLGEPALSANLKRFVNLGVNPGGDRYFSYLNSDGSTYNITIEGKRQIVSVIELSTPPLTNGYAGTPVTLHKGTSYADAVVLKAGTEGAALEAEHLFLRFHPCGSAKWANFAPTVIFRNAHYYSVLDATCGAGGPKHTFYFDISSAFASR